MEQGSVLYGDGLRRCPWPGRDPVCIAYHDLEWGVPEHDDRALYEKLVLDGFQAGLSWRMILHRREALRRAFGGFDPATVARFDRQRVEELLRDTAIIRNRAKIMAAITGARIWLEILDTGGKGAFAGWLWSFAERRGEPRLWRHPEQIPTETPASRAMSQALAKRGFRFCGPVICHAFMQAVGMVNDHLEDCHFRTGRAEARSAAPSAPAGPAV